MKTIRFILAGLMLVSITSFYQFAGAQEKSKGEREKELRIQQEIDEQKRAVADQKRAEEEMQKAFELQKDAINDAMKELQDASKYKDILKAYKFNGEFPRFNGQPFMWTPGSDLWLGHTMEGDSERTTWDFTKSIKESSFSSDYTFEVEPTVETVNFAVNGDCKAGEIRIKIIMPNGKTYSDIVIDEFGNLNWRKSFRISEEENKDKTGKWEFKIDAEEATGYFKISLQTF